MGQSDKGKEGLRERKMSKKEIADNIRAVNTFGKVKNDPYGSKGGTQFKGKSTSGASPMDVEAIIGNTQSDKVKGGLTGIAGVNTKNLGQLQKRATIGQLDMSIDTPLGKIPAGVGSIGLNILGKKMANTILQGISKGNAAVFDSSTNNIVGFVSKNRLGVDVYTGMGAFNPLGRKDTKRVGKGYSVTAREGQDREGPQEVVAATDTSVPTSTGSATPSGVSAGARRSMLASRQSGAARRLFIT